MKNFQDALAMVHGQLSGLHAQGVELRASVESLRRLAQSAPVVEPAGRITPPAPASPVERPQERAPVPMAAESEPVLIPVLKAAPAVIERLPERAAGGADKAERLAALSGPALVCTKCPHLAQSRTQVVFGIGNPDAELMFIGEAPGEEEDLSGEPFVGKAGQLLTKIMETMGFPRAEVYIANVLKCRPDMPEGEQGNRKPTTVEMQTCLPYLRQQIEIIQPRAIVALGAVAMEGLLGETQPMSRLRGRWHRFEGIPVMATYHPAYLVRNQALSEKRKVWEDMLLVLEGLGRPISDKQRGYFLPKA